MHHFVGGCSLGGQIPRVAVQGKRWTFVMIIFNPSQVPAADGEYYAVIRVKSLNARATEVTAEHSAEIDKACTNAVGSDGQGASEQSQSFSCKMKTMHPVVGNRTTPFPSSKILWLCVHRSIFQNSITILIFLLFFHLFFHSFFLDLVPITDQKLTPPPTLPPSLRCTHNTHALPPITGKEVYP